MTTTLDVGTLLVLRTAANREAATTRFPDPALITQVASILARRGEDWGASVLQRQFMRRSMVNPDFPWLGEGEDILLILADRREIPRQGGTPQ